MVYITTFWKFLKEIGYHNHKLPKLWYNLRISLLQTTQRTNAYAIFSKARSWWVPMFITIRILTKSQCVVHFKEKKNIRPTLVQPSTLRNNRDTFLCFVAHVFPTKRKIRAFQIATKISKKPGQLETCVNLRKVLQCRYSVEISHLCNWTKTEQMKLKPLMLQ